MTVDDLWAQYYPEQTPEQVWAAATAEGDVRDGFYRAVLAAMKSRNECQTEADLPAWRKRVVDAKTALCRHDGTPEQYIDQYGNALPPEDICRECWKPGAVADGLGEDGYHVECRRALGVRCDLRSVHYARTHGDPERAAMWERCAMARHKWEH